MPSRMTTPVAMAAVLVQPSAANQCGVRKDRDDQGGPDRGEGIPGGFAQKGAEQGVLSFEGVRVGQGGDQQGSAQ